MVNKKNHEASLHNLAANHHLTIYIADFKMFVLYGSKFRHKYAHSPVKFVCIITTFVWKVVHASFRPRFIRTQQWHPRSNGRLRDKKGEEYGRATDIIQKRRTGVSDFLLYIFVNKYLGFRLLATKQNIKRRRLLRWAFLTLCRWKESQTLIDLLRK